MNPESIDALSKLLAAIAQLLWPVALVVLAIVFRSDLSSMLKRIRKGKLLGQEVELDSQITRFELVSDVAISEVAASTRKVVTTHSDTPMFERGKRPDALGEDKDLVTEEMILRLASTDPSVAVMKLGSLLEVEIRAFAVEAGIGAEAYAPVRELIRELSARLLLPESVFQSLNVFWDLRNKVVHGEQSDGLLRVVDAGMGLLRTLSALRDLHRTRMNS